MTEAARGSTIGTAPTSISRSVTTPGAESMVADVPPDLFESLQAFTKKTLLAAGPRYSPALCRRHRPAQAMQRHEDRSIEAWYDSPVRRRHIP